MIHGDYVTSSNSLTLVIFKHKQAMCILGGLGGGGREFSIFSHSAPNVSKAMETGSNSIGRETKHDFFSFIFSSQYKHKVQIQVKRSIFTGLAVNEFS